MDYKYLRLQFSENPKRIRALLNGITTEQARFKPSAGSWSMLEVINHLYDEEIHDFRAHLNFILHQKGGEWEPIAPQAWVKLRKYNKRNLATSLENFLRERRRSIRWLDSLGRVDWNATYTSKFGSMKAGDMFASWVAHDGLHLRQFVELHRALAERAVKPYKIGYAGKW
jgi:hypothetical protein